MDAEIAFGSKARILEAAPFCIGRLVVKSLAGARFERAGITRALGTLAIVPVVQEAIRVNHGIYHWGKEATHEEEEGNATNKKKTFHHHNHETFFKKITNLSVMEQMRVCVRVVDWYLHMRVSECGMESSQDGFKVSTFISVRGVTSHGPSCEVFCSKSFVPRTLFRIITEPQTASKCRSFEVIFPGMVFNISVRFFVIIPVAQTIIGTTLVFFSFQDLFTSFLRSWYLIIFLISALFSPKSLVLTPQSAIPSSLFCT